MTEKQQLRNRQKERLRNLSETQRVEEEQSIFPRVLADALWGSAELVCAYLPMPFEFRLEPLLERALNEGKRVALPRAAGGKLRFSLIPSLEQPWELHPFGMREPPAGLPELSSADISAGASLIIVPGLAFDRRGYRLGFGGGYYDRFLGGIAEGIPRISLCYSVQLVDEVPRDEHDQRLTRIFCPAYK